MIDHPARRFIQAHSKSIVSLALRLSLRPNHVTLIGFFISFTSVYFIIYHHFIMAICMWWVGRICDAFDGIIARGTGQESIFGGFLDLVLDMLVYSSIVVSFAFIFPQSSILFLIILVGYVLSITTALALGELQQRFQILNDNRSLSLASGLAEAGETGIYYTLVLLFPDYINLFSIIWIIVLTISVTARIISVWQLQKRIECKPS